MSAWRALLKWRVLIKGITILIIQSKLRFSFDRHYQHVDHVGLHLHASDEPLDLTYSHGQEIMISLHFLYVCQSTILRSVYISCSCTKIDYCFIDRQYLYKQIDTSSFLLLFLFVFLLWCWFLDCLSRGFWYSLNFFSFFHLCY